MKRFKICTFLALDKNTERSQPFLATNAYTCELSLTNRFHATRCLFSKRSRMTSKCDKNKKVANRLLGDCVTDVLTTY